MYFVKLLSQSDPVLVWYRSDLFCERCGLSGHTVRTKCSRVESQEIIYVKCEFKHT